MKLTDRDKKLLVFLVIFVVVVCDGFLLLRPMMQKNTELETELAIAESEKAEKEKKVQMLPVSEARRKAAGETLNDAQSSFYEVMRSSDVDKLLTEMALSHELLIKNLDIAMPGDAQYTALEPYIASRNTVANSADSGNGAYAGAYSAQVTMTMSGDRFRLQAMLDDCAELEPKLRVVDFRWTQQQNTINRMRTLAEAMAQVQAEEAAQMEERASSALLNDRTKEEVQNSDELAGADLAEQALGQELQKEIAPDQESDTEEEAGEVPEAEATGTGEEEKEESGQETKPANGLAGETGVPSAGTTADSAPYGAEENETESPDEAAVGLDSAGESGGSGQTEEALDEQQRAERLAELLAEPVQETVITYQLTISMELYMYEDEELYLERKRLEKEQAAQAAGNEPSGASIAEEMLAE